MVGSNLKARRQMVGIHLKACGQLVKHICSLPSGHFSTQETGVDLATFLLSKLFLPPPEHFLYRPFSHGLLLAKHGSWINQGTEAYE